MTPEEALEILNQIRHTAKGRMLWAIVGALREMPGQYDCAAWCLSASRDKPARAWSRAVAVLRLPADVRRAAQWN